MANTKLQSITHVILNLTWTQHVPVSNK